MSTFNNHPLNTRQQHIDRRFARAQAIFKAMQPDLSTKQGMARLRSPEYSAWSRVKCDQMTRITRRALRMIEAAE